MNVVLCGPPASGKTTLAKALQDGLGTAGVATRLLHSDDFDRETYDRMYERVTDHPDANWILDGTFYTNEYQNRFRSLPDTYLVWVQADKETCIERNDQRADSIADVGVYSMYAKFETPDADLVLDTETNSRDTVETTLVDAAIDWAGATEDA